MSLSYFCTKRKSWYCFFLEFIPRTFMVEIVKGLIWVVVRGFLYMLWVKFGSCRGGCFSVFEFGFHPLFFGFQPYLRLGGVQQDIHCFRFSRQILAGVNLGSFAMVFFLLGLCHLRVLQGLLSQPFPFACSSFSRFFLRCWGGAFVAPLFLRWAFVEAARRVVVLDC